MSRNNIDVNRIKFDCNQVHDQHADIVFRITTGTGQIEENWIPGNLTNAGANCNEKFEVKLIEAFFSGFRGELPDEFVNVGYRIDILSHWYHPVDSSERSYFRAGVKAANHYVEFPDVFNIA